jgi:hypothetical protein
MLETVFVFVSATGLYQNLGVQEEEKNKCIESI